MHIRKQTIGRKMLRIFEIALFFAISVIGYGFILKVSSSSTKSKSRDRDTISLQRSLDMNGLHRELTMLSGKPLFPTETITDLPRGNAVVSGHLFATTHPLPRFAHPVLSVKKPASPYLNANSRLPRPCNLLEQNPVLLN